MAIGPIVEWAKAIWDGVLSKGDIQIVWQKAHSTMAGRAMPFRNVKGPGGATLASCMRIGWKFPSPTKVIKKDGSWLDMQSVCPMQIRLHALSDLSSIEAESSSLASRIGGPPNLEPLCDYLATKKMRESPAAGSLRALGEGGWWTQDRLFAEGRADDQWCKACGDRGTLGPAVGSLHHRMCACSATKELRDSFKGQAIIAKAQNLLHCGEPLFQHVLPIAGAAAPVHVNTLRECGGKPMPCDFVATGRAFTDGALKGRAPKSARRAGWAWVVTDEVGNVVFGLY